jgi:carboxypeptidase Q
MSDFACRTALSTCSALAPAVLALLAGCAGGNHSGREASAGAMAPDKTQAMAIIDGKPAPVPAIQMGDPAVVARIIDEGKNRNHVMDHLNYIAGEIGPRLTGSTNVELANRWTLGQFRKWGLQGEMWQWGTIGARFDRGKCTGKVVIARSTSEAAPSGSPTPTPAGGEKKDAAAVPEFRTLREMEFTSSSWTAGTNGAQRGLVVRMPTTDAEYDAVKDKLKGAWVLVKAGSFADPAGGGRGRMRGPGGRVAHREEVRKKVADEHVDPASLPVEDRVLFAGISGFVSTSRDERVWTGGVRGWRDLDADKVPPDVEVSIRLSDYDYINSRLTDGDPVQIEFDLPHRFTKGPIPVYDTIAEIRGSQWPDQVVIVSGHLDSWDGPGSQGATDNGTGAAVTLEAARLLMAAHAKPKRTIRFILWTGEEQGLLGSKAYIDQHKEEMDKISCVLVDDGGTNYEGGLTATDEMVPMLAAATAPVNPAFPEMTVNIHHVKKLPRGIGSDHDSFLQVGVPGFFWDEVGRADYNHGHHTQFDRLDLCIPEYLVQSSTCAAVTAYNLACAPTMLPREAVPSEEKKDDATPTPPARRRGQGS